jgi:hypothetical protein
MRYYLKDLTVNEGLLPPVMLSTAMIDGFKLMGTLIFLFYGETRGVGRKSQSASTLINAINSSGVLIRYQTPGTLLGTINNV